MTTKNSNPINSSSATLEEALAHCKTQLPLLESRERQARKTRDAAVHAAASLHIPMVTMAKSIGVSRELLHRIKRSPIPSSAPSAASAEEALKDLERAQSVLALAKAARADLEKRRTAAIRALSTACTHSKVAIAELAGVSAETVRKASLLRRS
jgi:hypothetical protein